MAKIPYKYIPILLETKTRLDKCGTHNETYDIILNRLVDEEIELKELKLKHKKGGE